MVLFCKGEDGIREGQVNGVKMCALSIVVDTYRGSVFFFSSKKRHTKAYGDWSLDVCFSDLFLSPYYFFFFSPISNINSPVGSSYERREGKVCRSRWSPHHL